MRNFGGGVCAGSVGDTFSATDIGYIGTSTDTGHTVAENGMRCDFGVIQPTNKLNLGLIDDFIYEGVHQQVLWGKEVAEIYYGKPVYRNYWDGCSTGGRQGLALAQEYGDLLDGYIVGAPAIYWQAFRLSDSWAYLVIKDKLTAIDKSITNAQWSAVLAAAIDACDVMGPDTVEDNLIHDPRACTWSATNYICGTPGAPEPPNCLDADQANAIDMIWDGPRNSHGNRIYYPFDRGINFVIWINLFPFFSTSQVVSYDHVDLTYNFANLYLDPEAIADAGFPPDAIAYEDEAQLSSRTVGDYMETQDVNLNKVKKHGGKIIMWHGMADPLIRWRGSKDYYRRVATYYGHGKADFAGLQSWFRYYAAPGVGHCGGGGPSPVDIFGVLVNWVENGVEPDTILGSGGGLTRPLCPFPTTAIYDGSGSTDEASNFYCGGNLETQDVICGDLRTLYKHETGGALDISGVAGQDCLKGGGNPKKGK